MTTFIEPRLLYFQQEVARCIKDPAVVSRLSAEGVITQDDSSRIKALHVHGDHFKANEDTINCLLKSRARGKWRSFLMALEQSEYHHLKTLLESSGRPEQSVERSREIIRIFTPVLEETINGKDIVSELYSKGVINQRDQELFLATSQNRGDTYATIVLLERMQCRLSPDEWYYHFLVVLVDKGYRHVVKDIEPDFLQCPDQFKPVKECSTSTDIKPSTTDTNSAEIETESYKDGYSSSENTKEHLLTDYVEAKIDKDDLGVPVMKDEICDQRAVDQETDLDGDCPPPLGDIANTRADKFCLEETCASTSIPPCFKTLGDRIPPEGQDLNVTSPSGSVAKSGKNTNQKMARNSKLNTASSVCEPGEKQDETPSTDDSEAVSNKVTTDDQGDTPDDTQKPLAKKLYTYQHELAEKALAGKNTIICAPTGSGKTWVALYIIDRHLNSSTNGTKKVAFMARHGLLVKQQVDRISEELTYARVKHLVGDTEEALMMQAFIEDYDIFFFTPQILVNNVNKDMKLLSAFTLLVFDECHHTKGGEAYNTLMKQYLLEKSKETKLLPQIVGMTASIGTGRATSEKDALDHVFRVCANLDVECLSLVEKNKEDLAKHVSLPTEETVSMQKRETDPCRGILLEAMRDTMNILSEKAVVVPKMIQLMHNRPREIESKRYGSWTAEVVNVAETLPSGQGRDIASCAKYLHIYHSALEVNRLLRTHDVALYIATQHSQEAEQQDKLTHNEKRLFYKLIDVQTDLLEVKVENPNVQVISKLLSRLFEEDSEDSRAMLFVHARATSRALAEYLNEQLADIFVKTSPLIGKDTRGTDKGMTEEEQTRVINDFREGNFKVLVATSVGMEGLDVPDCNLILNYNFTIDDITKIQMSGRSRKKGGKSVMIATDTQVERDRIAMYRIKLMMAAIEEFMKLDNNSISRRIRSIQKNELDDYRWFLKTRDLKRSKQTDETDYEIRCRKCAMFVCNASDIRKLDTSHLVAVRGFGETIRKVEHSKRQNMGPLKKRYKMYCRMCTNDWGIVADKDKLEYYILKLECMKFVSSVDTRDVNTYDKWIDVPYKIKDITIEDLSRMYDDKN